MFAVNTDGASSPRSSGAELGVDNILSIDLRRQIQIENIEVNWAFTQLRTHESSSVLVE